MRMPAAFLGHGSPMNTLADNRFTAAWRALGASVPTPRAVLCVSAHWYINATAVTAMANPRTIHDFYGFPDELFAVDYPAPGAPDLIDLIVETVDPHWVGRDHDSWGIDHGTWSVLSHVFPDADVPVMQLSINATQPLDHHLDLGRRLAPLRDEGVLIVGSGNVVHNLGAIDWGQPETGFDWAHRFHDATRAVLDDDPAEVLRLVDHADFATAVPTPDHFIPFLYLAALAAESGETPEVLVDGYTYGSISMDSYTIGDPVPAGGGTTAVDRVDHPEAPPAETNI